MMEDIVTFLPGQLPAEERFAVEMTGITYPDARYHIEREHSPLHCLEYVISGEGHIVMEGREYRPKAGDAYLLAAGKDHSYWADADRPWKKIWMNISGSLADSLVAGYGLTDAVVYESCPVYPQFWEFLRVCRTYGRNRRELADFAGLPRRTLTMLLQRLAMRGLIKQEDLTAQKQEEKNGKEKKTKEKQKEKKDREKGKEEKGKKYRITFLPAADPVLEELSLVERDFDDARFGGFDEEELIQYTRLSEKMKRNMQRILYPGRNA